MHVKLVLIVAPELEEELVDVLLEHPDVGGFTSSVVAGNGKAHNMSLAEQVTGRRKRLRFELVLAEASLAPVLEQLRTRIGANSVYWVESLLGFGKLA